MPQVAEHVKSTLEFGKKVSLTKILVTTDFTSNFSEVFKDSCLPFDVCFRLRNYKTLRRFCYFSNIGICLLEEIFIGIRHSCII